MIYWMQITSRRGPIECCWVVAKLARHIIREAEKQNIKVYVLETVSAEKPNIFKSVLLALENGNIPDFVKQYSGTVQWVGKSTFRPGHKRNNFFVGVNCIMLAPANQWSDNEFRFEKMRSSGPGGQHANKTESAVRITHVPTGLSAFAQEERSQHLNRKLAMTRLSEMMKERESKVKQKAVQKRWSQHNKLERGNPVKVFHGTDFIEKVGRKGK